MKRRAKYSKIYTNLIFAFLIVIAPIYIVSLKINEYGEQAVREEIEHSMQSRVHFYIHLLENEFSRIVYMQKAFINDRELLRLGTASQALSSNEFREAVYSVNSRLKSMMNSSEYIADADVFLPEAERIVSVVSLFDKLPTEEYEALKSTDGSNPFVYWNNRLFVSFPYSELALINNESPVFLVSAEISQKEVTEVLDRLKIDSRGGAMIIGVDGEWIVSSDGERSIEMRAALPAIAGKKTDPGGTISLFEIEGERHWVAMERSDSLGITLAMYMPEEALLGKHKRYEGWFWLLSGISVLVVALFSYWIFRQIHQPIKRLVRAFEQVEKGNLAVSVTENRSDEFNYLYRQFNAAVKKIDELIHEVYEQKYRANLSELRHLQSQINPHFLYNSFFILSRMTKYEDYESINKLSNYLGAYFRFITRTHAEEVSMEEEAEHAKTYVHIQTFRFEERIEADFAELPGEYAGVRTPRLILQPIVENVYEHGLKNK
ncbi:sensor histidine kinase [Paenibacillus mendelii]|uniref:Sensor histidine kinase n=1 Tax=Paenibacillus mendelii TaxID=206163 RepID=A0ABV6J9L5_9BACL|nr:histidine kinase [Paenibacillus mendelii]MCQ6563893.1 histidine kinase [Paenibacillus mendelii]